jgi:ketosteroid isomerase-like protein
MNINTKTRTVLVMILMLVSFTNQSMAQSTKKQVEKANDNRQVVDSFFNAMEAQKFEAIKEIFAENAVQLLPYAPEGFPNRLEGSEAIYNQFSGLTAYFSQMKFAREIYATEDPNFFFVKFKGDMEVKSGGNYKNDYLATFKLENGKIIEYVEYFNPIVMAKAFGIKLN